MGKIKTDDTVCIYRSDIFVSAGNKRDINQKQVQNSLILIMTLTAVIHGG